MGNKQEEYRKMRSLVPLPNTPPDVLKHFTRLQTPSNAMTISEDLNDEFQTRLDLAAGFLGLVVLGGYTRHTHDGCLLITWRISIVDCEVKPTVYELKEVTRVLRRQYKAFSSEFNLYVTPLVEMTFIIKPPA